MSNLFHASFVGEHSVMNGNLAAALFYYSNQEVLAPSRFGQSLSATFGSTRTEGGS